MEASYQERPQRDPSTGSIYNLWVVMNLSGWVFGGLLGALTSRVVGHLHLRDCDACASMATAVFVIGVVLGFAQWIVIRRVLRGSAVWVVATAVGLSLGYCVGFKLINRVSIPCHPLEDLPWVMEYRSLVPIENFISWEAELIAQSLAMALTQYVTLRRWVERAGLWIVATVVSYTLAFPFGCVITKQVLRGQPMDLLSLTVSQLAGGLLFGLGTGAMLVLLLRRSGAGERVNIG